MTGIPLFPNLMIAIYCGHRNRKVIVNKCGKAEWVPFLRDGAEIKVPIETKPSHRRFRWRPEGTAEPDRQPFSDQELAFSAALWQATYIWALVVVVVTIWMCDWKVASRFGFGPEASSDGCKES